MNQIEGLRVNPVVVLYVINSLVALAISFGLPLSHEMVQAVTVIVTAGLTFAAAVVVRPVTLSVCSAAATTALTACAAFGLHLSSDQIGLFAGVVSVLVAYLTHQAVTPVAKMPVDVAK